MGAMRCMPVEATATHKLTDWNIHFGTGLYSLIHHFWLSPSYDSIWQVGRWGLSSGDGELVPVGHCLQDGPVQSMKQLTCRQQQKDVYCVAKNRSGTLLLTDHSPVPRQTRVWSSHFDPWGQTLETEDVR